MTYPIPLVNHGVNCYWNALVQCLLSCPAIAQQAASDVDAIGAKYLALANATQLADATPMLRMVPKFGQSNDQESASEGLVMLADAFPALDWTIRHRHATTITCEACGHAPAVRREEHVHVEMFGADINTAEQLSAWLMRREERLADYKCDRCKARRATRVTALTMVPEVIVLLYRKYSAEDKRRQEFVPAEFTLPLVTGAARYALVGVVRHAGTLAGGHYWAEVTRGGERSSPSKSGDARFAEWHRADDATITKIAPPTNMQNVYIAFYHT